MSKFTLGEWKHNENLTDTIMTSEIESGKKTIARIVAYPFYNCSIDEANANGKLIAAAPNMYKDLKSLMLSISSHPDYINGSKDDEWHTLVSQAKKTLRKATS